MGEKEIEARGKDRAKDKGRGKRNRRRGKDKWRRVKGERSGKVEGEKEKREWATRKWLKNMGTKNISNWKGIKEGGKENTAPERLPRTSFNSLL